MKNNKGFTLIELLVVIAIIGVLSAIIVGTLGVARNRGDDAAIKAGLTSIRSEAELYYYNNGNKYATVNFGPATCPTTVSANSLFSDKNIIDGINASLAAGGNGTQCVATANSYAISAGLKTSGLSWCVDSQGTSKQFSGTPAAAITGGLCS